MHNIQVTSNLTLLNIHTQTQNAAENQVKITLLLCTLSIIS